MLINGGASPQDALDLAQIQGAGIIALQEVKSGIEDEFDPESWYLHYAPFAHRDQGTAIAFKRSGFEPPQIWSMNLPGGRRVAIGYANNILIASVHLSLHQLVNRWQLHSVRLALEDLKKELEEVKTTIICGDTNIVGPCFLKDMKDAGPRAATHRTCNIFPARLDRFFISPKSAKTTSSLLPMGKSDHHPILVSFCNPE